MNVKSLSSPSPLSLPVFNLTCMGVISIMTALSVVLPSPPPTPTKEICVTEPEGAEGNFEEKFI